jgi:hypothetical protein
MNDEYQVQKQHIPHEELNLMDIAVGSPPIPIGQANYEKKSKSKS